jgi:hypothetical protein
MEDILDTYALVRDPNIPLVCMDEQPVQLLGDRHKAIEMKPGSLKKEDYQYTRKGTASIFMFTAPLECWRHVSAQEHRTKLDWAHQIHELLTVHFPDAEKIRLVDETMSQQKNRRFRGTSQTNCRMGATPQFPSSVSQVALHCGQGSQQIEITIPRSYN